MALTIVKPSVRELDHRAGVVQLHGQDAMELYLAEIQRNLDAIDTHVALLQAVCIERSKLLRELRARVPGGPTQPASQLVVLDA